MLNNKVSWKIGGEAGFGIMVTGNTLCRALSWAGFWTFGYSEYPSLIRGGHNTFQIDFSRDKVHSTTSSVDLLVALNKETVDLHKGELSDRSIVIFDPDDFSLTEKDLTNHARVLPIPLLKLAKEAGGDVLMRNTVSMGATMAVLGLPFSPLECVLTVQFKRKGEKVVSLNIQSAKKGYDFVKQVGFTSSFQLQASSPPSTRMVLTLNEAIGLGAIAAGCKFFAAYPMTPINGLLSFMAGAAEKAGFIYKQPEDEIAGINMTIGASFGGVRAMTATSGGGFSLMVEALGMAGMTETPLVVVLGQRPGPSSGLPTWTGQGDLQFALNASQGEFLRFILAPGDPQEAFDLTVEAFNLADTYQTPVILLVDKFLCESLQTTDYFDTSTVTIDRGKLISPTDFEKLSDYKRYQLISDGVSPRALPGTKGPFFVANSYEHDEFGYSTEDASQIKAMVEKRDRKTKLAGEKVPEQKVYGPSEADVTFVGWGSTKAPMLAALEELAGIGKKVNYLHLTHLAPFPSKGVSAILKKAKTIVNIEENTTAQAGRLLKEHTGIIPAKNFLKYDGRPFFPEEIVKYVKEQF